MSIRTSIANNKVAKDFFMKHLSDFYPNGSEFVLKEVKPNFEYHNNKRTDQVQSISYRVVDTISFDTFVVKVKETTPIITQQELEARDMPVYIQFPLENTVVKPYSLEFTTAKVSIVAPYIELIES